MIGPMGQGRERGRERVAGEKRQRGGGGRERGRERNKDRKLCLLDAKATSLVMRMQVYLSVLGGTSSLEGCSSQSILH